MRSLEQLTRRAGLIESGSLVTIGRRDYLVGQFIPSVSAWELWESGEFVAAVRELALANMMKAIRFPKATN